MYVKPPGLNAISRKEKALETSLRKSDGGESAGKEQQEKSQEATGQQQSYKEKGPMLTMLKGRALCEEGGAALHVGMDAPHGGLDPAAENQQLVFSDGEEDPPTITKRKRRKKHDKVKRAEAILAAAGYDVKAINKQIDREVKKQKRGHRSSKPKH